MDRIARLNNRGTSLIELLMAMTILAIVATALMKSSIIVLQNNVQNEMRDEAVRIAEQRMNEIRSGPGGFDNANGGIDLVQGVVTFPTIFRTIRSAQTGFTVTKNVVELDRVGLIVNTKQVTVTVDWTYRGRPSKHSIVSIIRRYGL
jgi:prepilin-type N-terminal cleavage/methylation domain-containing protein